MKNFLAPLPLILLLSACSPHPGSGNWQARGDNTLGIEGITVAYEGKAVFNSTRPAPANWHCFWNAADGQTLTFDCTPSTDPDAETRFVFSIDPDGSAILSREDETIGVFTRTGGKPSIP